jgi:hypothetical protein
MIQSYGLPYSASWRTQPQTRTLFMRYTLTMPSYRFHSRRSDLRGGATSGCGGKCIRLLWSSKSDRYVTRATSG